MTIWTIIAIIFYFIMGLPIAVSELNGIEQKKVIKVLLITLASITWLPIMLGKLIYIYLWKE